jgi:hypothetical protein
MTTVELTRESIIEQVCALRQRWDERGVNSFIEKALRDAPLELVHRVAIEAAKDNSASSPAVIPWRCAEELRKQSRRKSVPIDPVLRSPRHCGYSSCECDHRECTKGWIDYIPEDDVWTTAPCPSCKPRLVEILGMTDLSTEERHELISTRVTP